MTLELPRKTIETPVKRRLDFRRLHAIKSDAEHDSALAVIRVLFDKGKKRTAEETDLLEFLSVLAEAYEDANVQMPRDASPQQVVEFLLEQNGMTRSDLYDAMGGKARVSEFLSRKRPLSRQQMVALRELLGVPLDLLI